jgi:hypothetical protein
MIEKEGRTITKSENIIEKISKSPKILINGLRHAHPTDSLHPIRTYLKIPSLKGRGFGGRSIYLRGVKVGLPLFVIIILRLP